MFPVKATRLRTRTGAPIASAVAVVVVAMFLASVAMTFATRAEASVPGDEVPSLAGVAMQTTQLAGTGSTDAGPSTTGGAPSTGAAPPTQESSKGILRSPAISPQTASPGPPPTPRDP